MNRFSLLVLCAIFLLGLCTRTAHPQGRSDDTSALINEALDKPVKLLELNRPLRQAMSTIEKQTDVRIEADPAVWELLPWGDQTNIDVKIENQTLRSALAEIARKLGLAYELRENVVALLPMPALARLGRRATLVELQALDVMTSTPLGLQNNRPTLREVVDAVDKKLMEKGSAYNVEFRPGNFARPETPVGVPRNATLAEALEAIARETDLTWYPWAKDIVVVPKEDQIRGQLEKKISARFSGVDVAQVLTELAQRSGVPFEVEAGAVARLPAEARIIKLHLDNASIHQALESIRGFTGLDYAVKPTGVYVWNHAPAAAAASGGGQDQVVAFMQLDNATQVLVRESQVPPDVRQFFRHKTTQQVEKIRQLMKEQGFTPATQPTTKPDEQ